MVVTAACSSQAPAAQQSTEADITLSGPVSITLWHALTGPQQVALDAMVKKFNDTNGKGITVTALIPGQLHAALPEDPRRDPGGRASRSSRTRTRASSPTT